MKKVLLNAVLIAVGLIVLYGAKHVIHKKCIGNALKIHCEKNYEGFNKVAAVEVPWWNPLNSEGYSCSAKIGFAKTNVDIGFVAKKATAADILKDDWEADMGLWGWLGDDYRIMNVQKQDK